MKTRMRVAVPLSVLVTYVIKKLTAWRQASSKFFRIFLSVTLFEKTPILLALQPRASKNDLLSSANQLILFPL